MHPSTFTPTDAGSWASTLYGVAYGDAHGYPTEFQPYEDLLDEHGPEGPDTPDELVVSDDTQMTLALARALLTADLTNEDSIRFSIMVEFIDWLHDPDNDRAPGGTCLRALSNLDKLSSTPEWDSKALVPVGWAAASVHDSKGCGANMRVAPAAFLPDHLWEPVAAFQAGLTHGHPTAVAATLLTAWAVRTATAEGPGVEDDLLTRALDRADEFAGPDVAAPGWATRWLPGLAEAAGFADVDTYFRAGWAEVRDVLRRTVHGSSRLLVDPWDGDVCTITGEGWVAEEALAAALLCVTVLPGDPEGVVRRAAMTGGDSDSIGAIAGAIIGASDPDAWDVAWTGRLEDRYAREFATLSKSRA